MSDQLGKMMLLGESDKGIYICMVNVLCFAATGIAGEKGERVRIYADGIFSHSKITFG